LAKMVFQLFFAFAFVFYVYYLYFKFCTFVLAFVFVRYSIAAPNDKSKIVQIFLFQRLNFKNHYYFHQT
jgi:hypothetical protein